MAKSLLISGTDTGVGKTAVTAALTAYWQKYRPSQSVAVFKPIQSGEGDREFYQSHFKLTQSAQEITPLQYEHPLAPPIAAELEGRSVDLAKVWNTFQQLQQSYDQVFIEGVGGLGTPITQELTVADLARDWQLPTLLVVPVRLGSIGQTIANVALARQAKVNLLGIILSATSPDASEDAEQLTPIQMLKDLTNLPVLGLLSNISNWSERDALALAASNLFLEPLLQ